MDQEILNEMRALRARLESAERVMNKTNRLVLILIIISIAVTVLPLLLLPFVFSSLGTITGSTMGLL